MNRKWALIALAGFVAGITLPAPAIAQPDPCREKVTLGDSGVKCRFPKEELRNRHHNPDDPYVYRVEIICSTTAGGGVTIGGCGTPEACRPPEPVYRYNVYRAPRGTTTWEHTGTVCLTSPDDLDETVTETEIREAFKTLTWPSAELIVDPDTRTLVNADTAFHTTRTHPVTQTITLLGVQITLEATPESWTWHWAQPGDHATATDLTPETTQTPGTPRPHPTVTHAYTLKGEANPSVDVTYTGRYRIAGGPWQDISDTHTVPGAPVTLSIHEARPRLIR